MRERDVLCQFWLTKKEADDFYAIVKQSGLNRSAYLRCLIRGVVPIELPPPDYYRFARELHAIGNNLNQIAMKAHVVGGVDAKRYEETSRSLDKAIKEITQAVFRHKEIERWRPPQCGE